MSDSIEAADLISEFVYDRWPDVVPINAVIIFEGLGANNQRGLYALSNTDIAPWTLEGMLSLVRQDNRMAWEDQAYGIPVDDDDIPDAE